VLFVIYEYKFSLNDLANFSKYISTSSSTYIGTKKNFSVEYGDGSSAQGIFSIDTVTVSYHDTAINNIVPALVLLLIKTV
jgi:hypothetical protein